MFSRLCQRCLWDGQKMTMKSRKFVWDRSNILCFHGHHFRDPFQTQILRTTVRYALSALGLVLGTISHWSWHERMHFYSFLYWFRFVLNLLKNGSQITSARSQPDIAKLAAMVLNAYDAAILRAAETSQQCGSERGLRTQPHHDSFTGCGQEWHTKTMNFLGPCSGPENGPRFGPRGSKTGPELVPETRPMKRRFFLAKKWQMFVGSCNTTNINYAKTWVTPSHQEATQMHSSNEPPEMQVWVWPTQTSVVYKPHCRQSGSWLMHSQCGCTELCSGGLGKKRARQRGPTNYV